MFQKSKISAHQKLANIIERDVTIVTWNNPLDDLVQDKLIMLGLSNVYDTFDPRITCQLYTIGPPLFYSYNGIAVQKSKLHPSVRIFIFRTCWLDSPYLKSINQALLTFYTDGTLEILKSRWIKMNKECVQKVAYTQIYIMAIFNLFRFTVNNLKWVKLVVSFTWQHLDYVLE